jgi:predicted Fe-S protein YdhL (DUF1289 family)
VILHKKHGAVSPDVASPCIDVCKMAGELCIGCYRTLDEIVRWSKASDDHKREILDAVARRRSLMIESAPRS